jgi:hypothetical protein
MADRLTKATEQSTLFTVADVEAAIAGLAIKSRIDRKQKATELWASPTDNIVSFVNASFKSKIQSIPISNSQTDGGFIYVSIFESRQRSHGQR